MARADEAFRDRLLSPQKFLMGVQIEHVAIGVRRVPIPRQPVALGQGLTPRCSEVRLGQFTPMFFEGIGVIGGTRAAQQTQVDRAVAIQVAWAAQRFKEREKSERVLLGNQRCSLTVPEPPLGVGLRRWVRFQLAQHFDQSLIDTQLNKRAFEPE